MKHLLLTTIAALVLVGCGESQQSVPAPEAKPVELVAEASTPEPPTAEAPDIDIHDAAYDGNIEAVKQHLDAGTDVDARDGEGETPLNRAAYEGHKETVELLIAAGADVNAKDRIRCTALHWAAVDGNNEIAELLIANAADVNAKGDDGRTPLHVAVVNGHKEIAKLLIAEGADVNATDGERTPLHIAAFKGNKETTEWLITKGADVNAKGRYFVGTPLDVAIEEDYTEVADLLRKHGGKTAVELSIHKAAEKGNIEAIKKHLAAGADVNAKDENFVGTPLDVAILLNETATADLLRKHGGKTGEELKAEAK